MNEIHIHGGNVTVNMAGPQDGTAASSIDVQRKGDVIQVWFNVGDQQVPLASHPIADGERIRIPFAGDAVRVKGNPRVETKA